LHPSAVQASACCSASSRLDLHKLAIFEGVPDVFLDVSSVYFCHLCSTAGSSGYSSTAGSSGDFSTAGSSGYYSTAGSSGYYSTAGSSGYYSTAAATGAYCSAKADGKDSIAVVNGACGKACGALGCYLVLTEYDDDHHMLWAKMAKVDGTHIKENVWYTLKNGEFVEVKP
jgi:hypothetical protein